MRNLFLLLALTVATAMNAQTFVAKTTNGFDVETGKNNGEKFTVDGKTFDVFETSKGSKFIKCTSAKTGKVYPVWVFKATEFTFEGKTVYVSSKGSYCVYKISTNTGNPYPIWLDKE